MSAELDHLFLCVSPDAPEAQCLAAFGLVEGAANQHPGQGTACRRFFFRNAYLELLWVNNPTEAQSAPIDALGLWGRWIGRNAGACPFGICFRPATPQGDDPPFPSRPYAAAYLPPGITFQVATNSQALKEPALFYLPLGRRSDSYPEDKRQPLHHPAGFREVSRVELITPLLHQPSSALVALIKTGLLRLRTGAEYHMVELGFDGECQGQSIDLRPELPLILRW